MDARGQVYPVAVDIAVRLDDLPKVNTDLVTVPAIRAIRPY